MRKLAFAVAFVLVFVPAARAQRKTAAPAGPPPPTLVFETVKGTIEIQLDPANAPKSVAHVLELAKRSFYRGQRFHRVEAVLVQFGDPTTRDMTRANSWGFANSGDPVGVAEITPRMKNVRGAVGLAHAGNPQFADSQLYILKAASPSLDGKHAIIGHVTVGMAVVDKLEYADLIKNVTVK
jgi:cyclophilin family peptidyl-prolyl cis-trans isomerase